MCECMFSHVHLFATPHRPSTDWMRATLMEVIYFTHLLIWILILSKNTFTGTPRIMLDQYLRGKFSTWVGKNPLEKEMTTYSSILTSEIPWTEEPVRLQSMGSQRVRHNFVTKKPYQISENPMAKSTQKINHHNMLTVTSTACENSCTHLL